VSKQTPETPTQSVYFGHSASNLDKQNLKRTLFSTRQPQKTFFHGTVKQMTVRTAKIVIILPQNFKFDVQVTVHREKFL